MNKYVKNIAAGIAAVLLCFSFAACEAEPPKTNPQKDGQKLTEQAYKQQSDAVPYPVNELKDSLERRNIRERLLRTNDPDAIGYVYLMNYGDVMGYYTIKGKVSSTQSQMTTSDLIQYACDDGLSGCQVVTVPAPGDDGSYGDNEDGIFFFTTEGAYVTTNLDYMYADQPLPFDVPELNSDK